MSIGSSRRVDEHHEHQQGPSMSISTWVERHQRGRMGVMSISRWVERHQRAGG